MKIYKKSTHFWGKCRCSAFFSVLQISELYLPDNFVTKLEQFFGEICYMSTDQLLRTSATDYEEVHFSTTWNDGAPHCFTPFSQCVRSVLIVYVVR